LIGASLFTLLILYFKMPAATAALLAIGCCFVFRMLAIAFNWKNSLGVANITRAVVSCEDPPSGSLLRGE